MPDQNGARLLYHACLQANLAAVECLLDTHNVMRPSGGYSDAGLRGAAVDLSIISLRSFPIELDANAESGHYGTPLQAAVRSGNADIVRLLKTPLAPHIEDSNELQRNLRLKNRQTLQRKLMRGSQRVE